ncbi:MAG: pseudouridine synthase [Brumimicrobium sp.]
MKVNKGKSEGGSEKGKKFEGKSTQRSGKNKPRNTGGKTRGGNPNYKGFKQKKGEPLPKFGDEIRLNKFLSNAGICSRREADTLISTGVVSVNGEIVTEMGYKVKPTDTVKYDGISINPEKKRYVLLNKPKEFVVSMDDPWGRKTVMSLVMKACKERVYPVGRMDRDTTGLLLFTNDSDMEKKLTHPKYKASKIYHVTLDKNVEADDLAKLTTGLYVDDAMFSAKDASFIKGKTAREVGVEFQSNKNNIVKLMFGKLGYEVVKLDCVQFAGLTKKDLPRGDYRHLTEKEVAFLKMN